MKAFCAVLYNTEIQIGTTSLWSTGILEKLTVTHILTFHEIWLFTVMST